MDASLQGHRERLAERSRHDARPSTYCFFGARCESADPAAVLEALLVRPSRKTLDAAFAAFAEVFRCFDTLSTPLSNLDVQSPNTWD